MLEDKVEKFQSCILWEKYSGVEMDSAALGGLSDSSHYLHVLIWQLKKKIDLTVVIMEHSGLSQSSYYITMCYRLSMDDLWWLT